MDLDVFLPGCSREVVFSPLLIAVYSSGCWRLSLSAACPGSGCVIVSASGQVRGSNTNIWNIYLNSIYVVVSRSFKRSNSISSMDEIEQDLRGLRPAFLASQVFCQE